MTVIGWVWILLGGLTFLSSIMAIFASISINHSLQSDSEATEKIPAMFTYFSFIAVGQMGVAFLGVCCRHQFFEIEKDRGNYYKIKDKKNFTMACFRPGSLAAKVCRFATKQKDER